MISVQPRYSTNGERLEVVDEVDIAGSVITSNNLCAVCSSDKFLAVGEFTIGEDQIVIEQRASCVQLRQLPMYKPCCCTMK